jgi:hypothetical protein
VEQCVCTGAFCITALIASSEKVFGDLTALVAALPAYKSLIPLQLTKVFFTIFFSFEALSKPYETLSFNNVHFMRLIIDKDMKLNGHLRTLIYIINLIIMNYI